MKIWNTKTCKIQQKQKVSADPQRSLQSTFTFTVSPSYLRLHIHRLNQLWIMQYASTQLKKKKICE